MFNEKNFLENNNHFIGATAPLDCRKYFSIDGQNIFLYYREWKTKLEISKGTIVLVHGMAEHTNRYSAFAEKLTDEGYNVFAYDQRGHGYTVDSEENLGYINKDLGWNNYINDLKLIVDLVKKKNTDEKVFIFGHSMGSFVARDFSVRYPEFINGLILSGSADLLLIDMILGLAMSNTELILRGKNGNAKNVDQFIGKRLNNKFKDTRKTKINCPSRSNYFLQSSRAISLTKFDWLNTDSLEVDKYINDPFCGFCPKTSFYSAFFKGLIKLHDPLTYSKVSKNLPMLLLTGQEDPVTNMGLGTIRLFNKLKENGVKDVIIKIYEDMRHEILNETNRDKVHKDIINWINKH